MVLHTVMGHWNIRKSSLVLNLHVKWSVLLVYSVMCLRKFDFCFSKNRRARIFFVLSLEVVSTLGSVWFGNPQFGHTIKTNCKVSNCWSRDTLNYDFLKKSLGLVFSQHFVCDFSGKTFFLLYSIYWLNFIVCLPLLREILGDMFIVIDCFPVYKVIYFEKNSSFLICQKLLQTGEWAFDMDRKRFWFIRKWNDI